MKKFQIWSDAGVDMGIWEATSAAEALNMMARDAGYASAEDASERTGLPWTARAEEVEVEGTLDFTNDLDWSREAQAKAARRRIGEKESLQGKIEELQKLLKKAEEEVERLDSLLCEAEEELEKIENKE